MLLIAILTSPINANAAGPVVGNCTKAVAYSPVFNLAVFGAREITL